MIVFEPNRTRRLVGRLERGESVLDALAEIALRREITSAWFQATGPLESAELAVFDAESRRYSLPKRVGACTAVQITGNLSRLGGLPFAHAHALVAPARPDAGEGVAVSIATAAGVGALVGGELRAAIAFAVEFALEAYEDVVLERFPDEATGLPLWRGKATVALAGSPTQLGWAAAASEAERFATPAAPPRPARTPHMPPERVVEPAFASQPIPEKKRVIDTAQDEPSLQKGDWIAHKQFGLCHVDGEDSEGAIVIRLPSGVRKVIRLDFLHVLPCHVVDDRRIFPLEVRKK